MSNRFVTNVLAAAFLALLAASAPLAAQAPAPAPSEAATAVGESQGSVKTAKSAEARRILEDFVDDLHTERRWYQDQRDNYNFAWRYGNIFVIVATGLTAFLIAIDIAKDSAWRRMALAALPALAALTTSLTGQFRVQEMWELREAGRLDVVELINEARLLRAETPDAMEKSLSPIRAKLVEIDRTQSSRFFSYLAKTPPNETGRTRAVPEAREAGDAGGEP